MPRPIASFVYRGFVALVLVSLSGCGQEAEEAESGSGAEGGAAAPAPVQTVRAPAAGIPPTEPSPECESLPFVATSATVAANQARTIPLTVQGLGTVAQLTVPQGAVASETTFTLSVPEGTKRVVVDLEARDASGAVSTFAEELELRLFVRSGCTPQRPAASRNFFIYRIPATGDSTLTGGAGEYDQNGNHVTRRLKSFSGYILAEG